MYMGIHKCKNMFALLGAQIWCLVKGFYCVASIVRCHLIFQPAKPVKEKNPDDEEKEEGEEDEEAEAEKQEEEEEPPQETLKYARGRNSGYNICIQGGLIDVAKKFGLSPEQFSENLRDNYQKHEVEQYPVEPMELAQENINRSVQTTCKAKPLIV